MGIRSVNMTTTRVSILIPVFNEGATIGALLDSVWNQPLPAAGKEMVIVESGSTDDTREKVMAFAAEKNRTFPGSVQVLLQARPRGKGNALREGFKSVTGDIILIQDGDLEYQVSDYPALIQPILDGKTSFVLGSRHLAAGTWKIRSFERRPIKSFLLNLGGVFFHGLFNRLYGQELTDPTTMFKVFRRECIEGLHFVSNRFDFDFELVAKLIRAGYPPLEVAVSYRSRGFEDGKKIRIFRDPFTWVWAIVKFRFAPLRRQGI